jgi:hypothetical protein
MCRAARGRALAALSEGPRSAAPPRTVDCAQHRAPPQTTKQTNKQTPRGRTSCRSHGSTPNHAPSSSGCGATVKLTSSCPPVVQSTGAIAHPRRARCALAHAPTAAAGTGRWSGVWTRLAAAKGEGAEGGRTVVLRQLGPLGELRLQPHGPHLARNHGKPRRRRAACGVGRGGRTVVCAASDIAPRCVGPPQTLPRDASAAATVPAGAGRLKPASPSGSETGLSRLRTRRSSEGTKQRARGAGRCPSQQTRPS